MSISGWWFGTFLFSQKYWECHHPNKLSYFSEGFKPPTRYHGMYIQLESTMSTTVGRSMRLPMFFPTIRDFWTFRFITNTTELTQLSGRNDGLGHKKWLLQHAMELVQKVVLVSIEIMSSPEIDRQPLMIGWFSEKQWSSETADNRKHLFPARVLLSRSSRFFLVRKPSGVFRCFNHIQTMLRTCQPHFGHLFLMFETISYIHIHVIHQPSFTLRFPRLFPAEKKNRFAATTGCRYGDGCQRANPVHFVEESHPGDPDYEATPIFCCWILQLRIYILIWLIW